MMKDTRGGLFQRFYAHFGQFWRGGGQLVGGAISEDITVLSCATGRAKEDGYVVQKLLVSQDLVIR